MYIKSENEIIIKDNSSFNPQHILECGQVFCFEKVDDGYVVFPQNKYAHIFMRDHNWVISTKNIDFFIDFFDLSTNYEKIKEKLNLFSIMKEPIKFGCGIRILKQNLFETLISFIISANNNIKRIKLILSRLREKLGENRKSFPSHEALLSCDEKFFEEIGAGYRAKYLYKVLRQVTPALLEQWRNLPTEQLRTKLIALAGVGPKVADCILLFGYGKKDVFPVDTWIAQMYNQFFEKQENREKMRKNLVDMFGEYSGYAQQYLFYFQRSNF